MKKNYSNIVSMEGNEFLLETKRTNRLAARRAIKGLRKRSRHNSIVLGVLEYDWPVATSIIESLSNYVGFKIGSASGEPVIYKILEFALNRYSSLLFHSHDNKHEDAARIAVFIDGLITKTCEIACDLPMEEAQKDIFLSTNNKQTLSDWVAKKDKQNCDEPSLRRHLYGLIANDNVKYILKSANYEQAVVLGSLAARH